MFCVNVCRVEESSGACVPNQDTTFVAISSWCSRSEYEPAEVNIPPSAMEWSEFVNFN